MSNPTYSIVIPINNEEEILPELRDELDAAIERLDGSAEVILVDDGSNDRSCAQMIEIHKSDPKYKVVQLSRNFGHQLAISAGLDLAAGEAVIVMDGDLQDPPSLIPDMAARWREGFEVVYAVRSKRLGESRFKRAAAYGFYRIHSKLSDVSVPIDTGDFRLVDRKALEAFKGMRENHRYVRGMFAWVGFRQTSIEYVRRERFAGKTKYPLHKMLRLAADGVVSFSFAPLRWALLLGLLVSALSVAGGVFLIVAKLAGMAAVPGWTSTMVLISFMTGTQLIVLGIMGEYVGRIYEEVKRRPLYLIESLHGIEAPGIKAVPDRDPGETMAA